MISKRGSLGMNIFEMIFVMGIFAVAFIVGHVVASKYGLFAGGLVGGVVFILLAQVLSYVCGKVHGDRQPRETSSKNS